MSLTKATYSMIEGAPVNVLDYGADPTGAADSTAAFDSAFATGKAVVAPSGTYRINLVIDASSRVLTGEGIGETVLKPFTATDPVIKLDGDAAGANISFFSFADFSIEGDTRQGDGVSIVNTSDLRGCDHVFMQNIRITDCDKGLRCAGRSIWNSFTDVFFDENYDGVFIQTDMACNTWAYVNCAARRNQRHGFYADKTSIAISGFIDFTFINFNTEYNGQDTAIATIYGFYCNAAEGWSLLNCTAEANGADLGGVTSYGFYFGGLLGRGVIMNGVWAVESDFPIFVTGSKKSGYIDNVYRLVPYAGGTGLTIDAAWADDEPKIELGPNINGTISVTFDVNGNWPITQGVDYFSSAVTSLNLKNRKSVTINTTAGTAAVATITGLISGDNVFIYNFAGGGGTNDVTLAAGLMVSGALYTIPANSGQSFKVLGFPENGKLVPL
jgi:hypothetical protein